MTGRWRYMVISLHIAKEYYSENWVWGSPIHQGHMEEGELKKKIRKR